MKKKLITLKGLSAVLLVSGLNGCGGDVKTHSDFTAVEPTKPVSDWQLVWSDEFDGNAIDTRKWTLELNCQGGGNQEQQCYTDSPQNAYVSGGTLKIVALPAAEGATKPYTSARLNTKYQGDWKYGRIEVRAKMPHGQGSWPAIWMLPTDDVYGGWPRSGEIDIMEAVNLKTVDAEGNVESRIHGTLHYGRVWPGNVNSGKEYTLPNNVSPADDFHTYAIEWQEGEIRWYVDDYLYQTQMASQLRYNSKNEVVGLRHRGWFAEYHNIITGELETHWDSAPFDQRFHLLLNLAVGGNWPENVNNLGIDAAAFVNGQMMEVDYVRVYQCAQNPQTGKGCETVRAGYKDENTLVQGLAPIPSPPSSGAAQNLIIFADDANPDWPAWDCCGGTTATIVDAGTPYGSVVQFEVGSTPTVLGFNTLQAKAPKPFDASPLLEQGYVSFDVKVVSAPADATSVWKFKIESGQGSTAVEWDLNVGNDGLDPVTGEWQHYSFSLQSLSDAGLDISAIDVLMIFPAWGTGNGAVFQVDNVQIAQPPAESPELVLFADGPNADWLAWDCCGNTVPTEELDDDAHGLTVQFTIGATPTVMGFKPAEGTGIQFDASALLEEGVVQFDMKVVTAPNDPAAVWKFKIEADGASSAVELDLSAGNAGLAPVTGQWQTYTFSLQNLSDAGLDISAIDVVMIFPAWGSGDGAVYRVDNARIFNPNADKSQLTIFQNDVHTDWTIWDCCAGSVPKIVDAEAPYGKVAQFEILGSPDTVLGFQAKEDIAFDAFALLANGSVSFDLRVVSAPQNPATPWLFKIESSNAATAVELPLPAGNNNQAPATGEWQHYRFPLQMLFDAGLDISDINVLMVFPAWGSGQGAVYQIDNVKISNN